MKDTLVKASGAGVRAFAAVTTKLTDEAYRRHSLYPIATAALGRTMTAAVLLAANLKNEETITIRIQGTGELKQIVADARSNGEVRGYVDNPQIDLPLSNGKLAVGQAVGGGFVHVTRFTGLKDPFTGSVPLVSGEIAEDITNYLMVSEQTPSTVALGVLVEPDLSVSAAGGFMVQAMPAPDESVLMQIETNIMKMPPVSQLISSGLGPVDILKHIFADVDFTLLEEKELTFSCSCSKERVTQILISLGKSELTEMADDGAELTCHFCGEKYSFSPLEINNLATSI